MWNPQYFTLLLLHNGQDLSANVGDAASLDDTFENRKGQNTATSSAKTQTRPRPY